LSFGAKLIFFPFKPRKGFANIEKYVSKFREIAKKNFFIRLKNLKTKENFCNINFLLSKLKK
jgi:transposase-like protein